MNGDRRARDRQCEYIQGVHVNRMCGTDVWDAGSGVGWGSRVLLSGVVFKGVDALVLRQLRTMVGMKPMYVLWQHTYDR